MSEDCFHGQSIHGNSKNDPETSVSGPVFEKVRLFSVRLAGDTDFLHFSGKAVTQ